MGPSKTLNGVRLVLDDAHSNSWVTYLFGLSIKSCLLCMKRIW